MAISQVIGVIQHLRRTVVLRDGAGLTDAQLLDDYIGHRDGAALAALVRRHGPMVWGVCRRVVCDYHDAEDAFQATFLVLARKAASIASKELFSNWLYGVAHQTALKARASAARRKRRERQVTQMPEPAVAEQDLWRDLQPLLDDELSRLPAKYRVVIVLCDLEGKTRKEAARLLGCPEGTVAGRLARARVMLAKRLAQRGVALSGGALAAVLSQNVASGGVPASVVSFTLKAASLFGAGQAAATGVISVNVAALTEGVLKTMFLSKLKIGAALLLMLAAIGIGAMRLNSPALQAERPEPRKEGPQVRAEPEPKKGRPREPKPITVSGRVAYLVWSPDGRTLVTSSSQEPKEGARLGNFTLQFWDAKTGQEKLSLGEEAETWLEEPTYSPDGKLLALSSFKKEDKRNIFEVKIYDADKGNLVREFKSHEHGRWLAFSPDGKTLATTGSKFEPFKGVLDRVVAEVKLWDVATGEMKRLLEDKRDLDFFNNFGGPAFSPDGKTLATPGTRFEYTRDMLDKVPDEPVPNPFLPKPQVHNEVVLWDVDTGKVERVLKGGSHWFSVTFSADGKFLVAADEQGEVRVWEVATGKLERTLVHERGVSCEAVLSRDGKWLATKGRKFNKESRQMDGSVKLWDYRTGEKKQTLPESQLKGMGPVAFSPDGKRLAVGVGSTARIWDIEKSAFEK
jgi:RNA polymerase sigma factor (sigma-70 family)